MPAAASVDALAVTVTGVVAPALTTTLAACAVDPTCGVTVQPSGPVEVALNGRSSAVSLVSVRLNEKLVFEAPLSWGVSVVRVTCPAAFGSTRIVVCSVVDPPGVVPTTSISCAPAVASAGTVTLSVTLVTAEPPGDSTPSMVNPPPRMTAVQPVGTLPTARLTRPGLSVVIDTSKLGLDPGATTMAGKGVVSVMADAAVVTGAPASNARPRIDVTRPSLVARNRAFRPTNTEPPPRTISTASWGTAATGRATIRGPGRRRV